MTAKKDLSNLKIIGDLKQGRPTLGGKMNVSVHRLNIYSMRAVLEAKFGIEETDDSFRRAGRLAGQVIYRNFLGGSVDVRKMLTTAGDVMQRSGIGKLTVSSADPVKREFLLIMEEDADCSGLPPDGETKCRFDEGMLSGILEEFYGHDFTTTEVRCWSTGGRECVFRSVPAGKLPEMPEGTGSRTSPAVNPAGDTVTRAWKNMKG